ncbi:MAG: tRNA (cytidine(34)-2'-O)-methyltransferase [Magnetococcales bacterium]|nr:tRNA (cytidine(34)-2'-O)-methyltransferase [Magnetococcales bacterium]
MDGEPLPPPSTEETGESVGGFHVVLYQPEIPPNTGNVMRLCAAAGGVLHLVGPLGFRLDAAAVRRAGMDYRDWVQVRRHADWAAYRAAHPPGARLLAVSTKGGRRLGDWRLRTGDRFLFGSEGAGLPPDILADRGDQVIRIPMVPRARSLNLANSVAVVLYEALRQAGYPGLE